jgi:hypothetical protein
MIRVFKNEDNKDLDRIMEFWLETNIVSHSFINSNHWKSAINKMRDQNTKQHISKWSRSM